MKKYIYTLIGIAAALSAFSCSQVLEEDINTTEDPQTKPVKEYVLASNIPATITADFVQTKTDYDSDGKFSWEVSDEVQLYFVDDIDTPANQGWVAYYIAGAGDIVGKKATFTIKAGQEGKTNAESGALKDYKNTGLAVYGRGAVNTVARPYSANTEPCSDLGGKFISLQQKLTGGASEVILLGTESEGVFSFRTAAAVLKVTVTGIPANASKLKLCTADNETSPLDGDFLFDDTRELQKGDYRKYSGGQYNSSHRYVYVDLSGEGAIDSRDFYFNIPTGAYDANTISLVLEDNGGNELLKKTITSAFTFNRNDLVSVSFANEWVTLGTGKYADYWMQGIEGVIEDLWDVTVQRNVADPQQYRIINPYGKGVNMVQSSTHDDYFYFTIDDSTEAVAFTSHTTGVHYPGGTQNFRLKYGETDANKIVLGDKDTPKVIQFSPDYVNADDESWSWPRKGLPYLVRLVMPDYVSAYSSDITITSDASSLAATFSAGASAKVSLYLSDKSFPAYIENNKSGTTTPTSISGVKWTNKVNGNSIAYSGSSIVSQKFSSGPLYLCYVTMDSSTSEILTLGTKVMYFLAPDDIAALTGSYTFSEIQALFHYYRTEWIIITSTDANSLVLAISDDPTKGNVKLTKIFGFGCDASTSSFVVDHKTTDNLGWKNDKDSDLTGTFAAGTAVYGQYASGSLVFPSPEANAFMTYNGTAVFVEGVHYSSGISYSNGSFGFTFTSDGSTATLTADPAAIMTLTFDDGKYNADHGIVYVTNNSSFSPTAFVATRSL